MECYLKGSNVCSFLPLALTSFSACLSDFRQISGPIATFLIEQDIAINQVAIFKFQDSFVMLQCLNPRLPP